MTNAISVGTANARRPKRSRSILALFPASTRQCSGCSRDLAMAAFARCAKNKDGLHSHCRECRSATKKAHYVKNAAELAAKHRQRTYGLDKASFASLVERQQNCCAICSRDMGNKHNRHIDHDHATGRVRELLCSRCNRMLGHVDDNPQLLRTMAAYIEKHRTEHD